MKSACIVLFQTVHEMVLCMIILATELKTNLGHYLELVAKEDIVITRNEKCTRKIDWYCK